MAVAEQTAIALRGTNRAAGADGDPLKQVIDGLLGGSVLPEPEKDEWIQGEGRGGGGAREEDGEEFVGERRGDKRRWRGPKDSTLSTQSTNQRTR